MLLMSVMSVSLSATDANGCDASKTFTSGALSVKKATNAASIGNADVKYYTGNSV